MLWGVLRIQATIFESCQDIASGFMGLLPESRWSQSRTAALPQRYPIYLIIILGVLKRAILVGMFLRLPKTHVFVEKQGQIQRHMPLMIHGFLATRLSNFFHALLWQLSVKFILLTNVKMPSIVGILTFISRIKIQLLRMLKKTLYFSAF